MWGGGAALARTLDNFRARAAEQMPGPSAARSTQHSAQTRVAGAARDWGGDSHIHALAVIAAQPQQGLRSHLAEVRVEALPELAPLAHNSTIVVETEVRQSGAAIPATSGKGIPGGGLEIFGMSGSAGERRSQARAAVPGGGHVGAARSVRPKASQGGTEVGHRPEGASMRHGSVSPLNRTWRKQPMLRRARQTGFIRSSD